MKWFILGISGVTCGGKTTLATKLYEYLCDQQNANKFNNIEINQVRLLHQDKYFYPRDSPKHIWIKEINFINREVLTAIDMEKMWLDIQNTVKCDDVKECDKNGTPTIALNENLCATNANVTNINILIVEGFLIFSDDRINKLCNLKLNIDLPYDVCLERRLKRTFKHVNPEPVKYFQEYIWPMYKNYVDKFENKNEFYFISGEQTPADIFEMAIKLIAENI